MGKMMVFPLMMFLWATLSGCASGQTAAGSTQASSPSQAATLAPSSLHSATTPAVPEFPGVVHPDERPGEVAAGKYRTPAWFSIPFVFETNQPFGGIGLVESTGELFALVPESDTGVVFFAVDPAISLEDTISLLRDTPGFEIGPNQSVKVAGLAGTQFDLLGGGRVPAISALIGRPAFTKTDHWLIQSDQHVRYIVLDAKGRVLLIEIGAPAVRFDAFIAKVDELLSTIEIHTDME